MALQLRQASQCQSERVGFPPRSWPKRCPYALGTCVRVHNTCARVLARLHGAIVCAPSCHICAGAAVAALRMAAMPQEFLSPSPKSSSPPQGGGDSSPSGPAPTSEVSDGVADAEALTAGKRKITHLSPTGGAAEPELQRE